MTTSLSLDLASGVPPYEQLRARVAGLVAAGSLRPGERLPPVRHLAADLGIAPGTVQRAYRELEAAGVVVSQRRHGTRVADAPPGAPSSPGGSASVREAARGLVRLAREHGLNDPGVIDLVRGVLAAGEDTEPGAD